MSAEILRQAAAQIRNDNGGVVSKMTRDGRRWLPVADWLEAEAAIWEDLLHIKADLSPAGFTLSWGESTQDQAVAVACAYLEVDQ